LSVYECVVLAQCALRLPPWDGSVAYDSVPRAAVDVPPMPAWLVRTCGHVAAGGLRALLNLLMAALHSASVARVEAAEARWAASAPFSEARMAAAEARVDPAARARVGLAHAQEDAALAAACSTELRVQQGMLKALLVIAHYTPGEPIFSDEALQETLFGLATTADPEVRLYAVQVLREVADADGPAARGLCSSEKLAGVVALCDQYRKGSSEQAASPLCCALELLETLLSARASARSSLPAGLCSVLAAVEEQAPPGSESRRLASGLRTLIGARPGDSDGGGLAEGLGRTGPRRGFGDAVGEWLNRTFSGAGTPRGN